MLQSDDLQPEPLMRKPTVSQKDITVNTGLKICFKKAHKFSMDPNSGGGPLGPFEKRIRGANTVACDFVPTGLG